MLALQTIRILKCAPVNTRISMIRSTRKSESKPHTGYLDSYLINLFPIQTIRNYALKPHFVLNPDNSTESISPSFFQKMRDLAISNRVWDETVPIIFIFPDFNIKYYVYITILHS